WSQAYYKMGLAQEKAGKYSDAIISLKKYLQLAPKSPDAAKMKEKIYKLEYQAEKVLALADISDILSSFAKWEKRGQCRFDNMMFENIKKVSPDSVRVIVFADGSRGLKFAVLKVEGPIFKFTAKIRNWDYQDAGLRSMFGIEPDLLENQIEVVSREHVIVRQKHIFNQTAARRLGTQQTVGSCEYFKK
ncbi:MAG: hypothetical protein JW914_06940, partial [Syntrophaceae bacterium]|nr:hypothetical protein [Syntrophaceae bacterium]